MTVNEAIKGLETLTYQCRHKWECGTCNICYSAVPLAIQALSEIQQYRAIGSVEEFKVLKEKSEPKKIDIWANGEEHCPFCDKNLTTFYGFANCFSCGQKLDWQMKGE